MSIYFLDQQQRDLWNPGNISARLFHAQAQAVAQLIGVDSGLGAIEKDEVVVDKENFIAFVQSFADWKRKIGSASVHAMLDGCFAIAAGLAEKLGATSHYGDDLMARARKFVE